MTDRQSTHGHDCWGWGPRHYECAVREIERLAARLAASQQQEQAACPSAPVGVDLAAVASILRRAMRDGAHYGYRRDFILQQALALEALSHQPAAVDGPDAQAAEIEALRAEVDRVTRELMDAITRADKLEDELLDAREFRDKLAKAIGNEQLRAFIEKHGEPVPLTIRMQAAEARAERLAEALRESHGEVLRLRAAMFRVYATAANGGDPTMYIEQMRDEMDKPWSGDKASAALEQEAGRG